MLYCESLTDKIKETSLYLELKCSVKMLRFIPDIISESMAIKINSATENTTSQ